MVIHSHTSQGPQCKWGGWRATNLLMILLLCHIWIKASLTNIQFSEEFELTANSPRAHTETHGKLIWGHSVTSQGTHKMNRTVSFLWVCNSRGELAVSYSWDHPMNSPFSGSSELTVWVANSWKAHRKLKVWAHLVSSLQANYMSSKWPFCEFKCELAVS